MKGRISSSSFHIKKPMEMDREQRSLFGSFNSFLTALMERTVKNVEDRVASMSEEEFNEAVRAAQSRLSINCPDVFEELYGTSSVLDELSQQSSENKNLKKIYLPLQKSTRTRRSPNMTHVPDKKNLRAAKKKVLSKVRRSTRTRKPPDRYICTF